MPETAILLSEQLRRMTGTPWERQGEAARRQLDALIQQAFNEAGLSGTLRRYNGRGSTSTVIRFDMESQWLIQASATTEVNEVVATLLNFIKRNELRHLEVALFWGLHPHASIQLSEELSLVPIGDLPPSNPRSFFLGESIEPSRRGETEHALLYPKPRAAMVRERTIGPIYVPFTPSIEEVPWTWDDKALLTDAMHVTALASGASVVMVAEWGQFAPGEVLSTPNVGYGWSMHPMVHTELPTAEIDEASLRDLVRGLVGVSLVDRRRLRLPLRRLSESKIREDFADRAIDVGIAIESLLTEDKDPSEGISHRLGVRGALLARTELAERQEFYKRVRAAYGLRSKAAHGQGTIEKNAKTRMSVKDGQEVVADLLTALLRLGGFPRLKELELTGTPALPEDDPQAQSHQVADDV